MSDREDAGLRGPVRSVRSEWASIDPQTSDWGPFKQGPTLVYDAEGWHEGRLRDDGTTVTTLDDRGLRTTVGRRGPSIPRQRGMEFGIGIDPNMLVDVLTRYDAADRPIEVVFRDGQQRSLHRLELTYDAAGRLVREKVLYGEVFSATGSTQEIAAGNVGPLSARELAELAAAMKAMMPDGVFLTREYQYDSRGRVVELRSTMAGLQESLQTNTYDDHDNVIEEHHEEASREADLDRAGRRVTRNENASESWNRHEYRYDARSNWIEKVTLHRVPPDSEFRRTGIERRTIAYF